MHCNLGTYSLLRFQLQCLLPSLLQTASIEQDTFTSLSTAVVGANSIAAALNLNVVDVVAVVLTEPASETKSERSTSFSTG